MLATASSLDEWKVIGVEEVRREGLTSAYLSIQGCCAIGPIWSIRESVESKIDVVPTFLEFIIQQAVWRNPGAS